MTNPLIKPNKLDQSKQRSRSMTLGQVSRSQKTNRHAFIAQDNPKTNRPSTGFDDDDDDMDSRLSGAAIAE